MEKNNFTISDIELRYRTSLRGKKNIEIFACEDCKNKFTERYQPRILGFCEDPNNPERFFVVKECPYCFKKFHNHSYQAEYQAHKLGRI